MANHCIYVACVKCGREYCARDCGYRSGPNKELAKWMKEHTKDYTKEPDAMCKCGGKMYIH